MAVNRLGPAYTGGSGIYQYTANRVMVCRVQVGGSNFTFRRGAIRVHTGGSTTMKTRLVVYADAAGPAPGALVASSNEVVGLPDGVSDQNFPITYTFPADVTLTASAYYWIGVHHDNSTIGFDSTTGGTFAWVSDTYSDGPPDPFGTPGGTGTTAMAVWLENSTTEQQVLKAHASAVLRPLETAEHVSKAYALAVLTQEAKASVVKAYALAVLAEGSADVVVRPQVVCCT